MDVAYHVALPFVVADDGLAPGEAVERMSECGGKARRGALATAWLRRRARVQPDWGSDHRRVRRRHTDPEGPHVPDDHSALTGDLGSLVVQTGRNFRIEQV